RWKDWIDRRFMSKYRDLPPMAAGATPAIEPGLASPEVLREISVGQEGFTLPRLNELECVGEFIFANVYQTNRIVKIDKRSGEVVDEIDGFSLTYYVAEEIDLTIRLKRWARDHDSRFFILHHHPLLTSGRKEWLYTRSEIAGTFWKMLRHPRRFFRDPSLCTPWYDGRR
ncbi:MAG: glutaminyl-peptide cyclotransferase, partial [Deltaproteobacteria bacterium]|nr:glutaminyl-peptide cyclotransferase [Deltaproteobacteria bacterium]